MQSQGTNTAMQPLHVDHCSLPVHANRGCLRLQKLHECVLSGQTCQSRPTRLTQHAGALGPRGLGVLDSGTLQHCLDIQCSA
jgi:hypothetical protein